jgi:hypothetical protein
MKEKACGICAQAFVGKRKRPEEKCFEALHLIIPRRLE